MGRFLQHDWMWCVPDGAVPPQRLLGDTARPVPPCSARTQRPSAASSTGASAGESDLLGSAHRKEGREWNGGLGTALKDPLVELNWGFLCRKSVCCSQSPVKGVPVHAPAIPSRFVLRCLPQHATSALANNSLR